MAADFKFEQILNDSGFNDQQLAQILSISEDKVEQIKNGDIYPNERLKQRIYQLQNEIVIDNKNKGKDFIAGKLVGNKPE